MADGARSARGRRCRRSRPRCGRACGGRRPRRRGRLGLHLHPGPDFLEALDDHALPGLEPARHDDEVSDPIAQGHAPLDDLVFLVHCQDRLLALGLLDGALRNEDGVLALLDHGAHSPELSRSQELLGIGEQGLDDDRPGLGVHGPVERGHPTLVRVDRTVGQDQLELQCLVGGRAAPRPPPGEPEVVHLAHGRGDLDRINGGHRGEQRWLAPADEVALVHVEPPDDPAHRGGDGRVGDVQLGLGHGGATRFDGGLGLLDADPLVQLGVLEGGLRRRHAGDGHLFRRERVVQVHLWHRLRLGERLEPRDVELGLRERGLALLELRLRALHLDLLLGPRQLGLRLGELRAGALEGRLVLGPLDLEQDLAFLDVRAFLEPDMLENPLDPGAKLHGLDGVGLRHELGPDRDRLPYHLRHDDRRGGGPAGAASLAFIRSQVVTIGMRATKATAIRARGAASVNRLRRIRRRYRCDTDLPERGVIVAPPGRAAPGAAGACEDARRRSITDPRAQSDRTDTAAPVALALANRAGSGLGRSPERVAPRTLTRFRAGWSTPRGAVPRRQPGPRSRYAQGRIDHRGDDAPVGRAGAGRCSTPLQVTPSLRVLPPVTGMMARESSARVAGVRPRKLLAFGPGASCAPSRRSEAAACGAGGLVPVVRGKKRSTGRPRAEARASSRDTARTTHWPAVLSHHGRRVAVASDGPQRWPPDEGERASVSAGSPRRRPSRHREGAARP